jgi:hypothetical protein
MGSGMKTQEVVIVVRPQRPWDRTAWLPREPPSTPITPKAVRPTAFKEIFLRVCNPRQTSKQIEGTRNCALQPCTASSSPCTWTSEKSFTGLTADTRPLFTDSRYLRVARYVTVRWYISHKLIDINLNHWVMHPVACVSTNICRNLRTQQIKRASTFVAYGGFYIYWFIDISLHCGEVANSKVLQLILIGVVGDDRLSGLVVRVSGYRSRGPVSIPGATRFSEK